MVLRANQRFPFDGHLSTYASAATLYAVGEQQEGPDLDGGDRSSSKGMPHRASAPVHFYRVGLTESHLDHFRRGRPLIVARTLTRTAEMWQFPTVSMGLSPIAAIYEGHASSAT